MKRKKTEQNPAFSDAEPEIVEQDKEMTEARQSVNNREDVYYDGQLLNPWTNTRKGYLSKFAQATDAHEIEICGAVVKLSQMGRDEILNLRKDPAWPEKMLAELIGGSEIGDGESWLDKQDEDELTLHVKYITKQIAATEVRIIEGKPEREEQEATPSRDQE